jgi:hypothetical protein
VVVCVYDVSPDFRACLTFSYVPNNTSIRALRTNEVEETVETLKSRQISRIFRKCFKIHRTIILPVFVWV